VEETRNCVLGCLQRFLRLLHFRSAARLVPGVALSGDPAGTATAGDMIPNNRNDTSEHKYETDQEDNDLNSVRYY
jgi:hypothetical protein